jgi:hypothetical protein
VHIIEPSLLERVHGNKKNSGEAAGFEFVLCTPKGCRSKTTAIL